MDWSLRIEKKVQGVKAHRLSGKEKCPGATVRHEKPITINLIEKKCSYKHCFLLPFP